MTQGICVSMYGDHAFGQQNTASQGNEYSLQGCYLDLIFDTAYARDTGYANVSSHGRAMFWQNQSQMTALIGPIIYFYWAPISKI